MSNIIKFPKRVLKTNVVYCADNLEVMKQLPSESIHFCYIDPPFNTGTIRKSKAWDKEVQIGDFDDRWGGGLSSYVHWLSLRLREMRRVLKPTGSIAVHLDYNSVHHVKVEMDKIFGDGRIDRGSKHLINEIIWCYKDVGGGKNNSFYKKKHDTILIYSKTQNYYSNIQRSALSETTQDRFGSLFNSEGVITYRILKEKRPKEFLSRKKQGRVPKNLDQVFLSKDYGRQLEDFWTDINPLRKRRKGDKLSEEFYYPTQKPKELLERFIVSFSKENDIVADWFCGCATTLSAAEKLNRRWIGCDVSKEASKTIRKRMASDHKLQVEILQLKSLTKAQILKLKHGEFEKYAVRSIGGTPTLNSKPVDGYMPDGSPIEVKMHDKPIGVGVLDKFHRFLQKNGRGYIVAKSFGRGFKDEVARLKLEEGLDVVFMTVDDILRDAS